MNNDFDVLNSRAVRDLLTPKDHQSEIIRKQDDIISELKMQNELALKTAEGASDNAKVALRQSTIANIISAISLLTTVVTLILSIK